MIKDNKFMYPKSFLENFWRGDQKNVLFVCMPFHDRLNEKFNTIEKVAKELGFENAVRVKEDWISNDITHKILDGISNSKTLLFDLSDDPKSLCEFSKRVNENVLYELGIATAIREPEDILLIKKRSESEMPFDVRNLAINEYNEELEKEWLKEKLKVLLDNQKWYKSKRVEVAAKSIDSFGLKLIHFYYKERPEKEDHFNDENMPIESKLAILRLLDLGFIWFATAKEGREYAYHWTLFGKEVIKYLGIKKSKI